MSYSIAATDIKSLFGSVAVVKKQGGGSVRFTIPKVAGWPRGGLEAYGLLVNCEDGARKIPSFLKIFKHDIPERAARTSYLASLGLHKQHDWLFQGIPYGWFGHFNINGVEIVGHVAQQVSGCATSVGEDMQRLRDQGKWTFSLDERRTMCGDLCSAVAAFEQLQLVHGDISTKNVMIGEAKDGRAAAILCDYDGFYHPSQSHLPEIFGGIPCRPIGSPGFQIPTIVEQQKRNQKGMFVDTDRFALGVMICELLAWEKDWDNDLGRQELLGDKEYQSRKLSTIPFKIKARCKDGFDMLEQALQAKDATQMPSPQDWLRGVLGVVPTLSSISLTSPINQPFISIYRRNGTQMRHFKSANITKNTGDFSAIDSRLASISYQYKNGMLVIMVGYSTGSAFIRRNNKQEQKQCPISIDVMSGDIIEVSGWRFEVSDGVAPIH